MSSPVESAATDEYGIYVTVNLAGVSFRMRWMEPGTFMMGSPPDEDGRDGDEAQHGVTLTQGYWLAETQCTQALWVAVMGTNPSRFKGAQRPVDRISWDDCQAFVAKANELVPGLALRLPTEAEWEYACRAGTTGARYGDLYDIAWYDENSGDTTHSVGQKASNAWGLYDMLGNVWEWCADWFGEYGASHAAAGPVGPERGVGRVLRGGSWAGVAWNVRSAFRLHFDPALRSVLGNNGVRFARGQDQASGPGWTAALADLVRRTNERAEYRLARQKVETEGVPEKRPDPTADSTTLAELQEVVRDMHAGNANVPALPAQSVALSAQEAANRLADAQLDSNRPAGAVAPGELPRLDSPSFRPGSTLRVNGVQFRVVHVDLQTLVLAPTTSALARLPSRPLERVNPSNPTRPEL